MKYPNFEAVVDRVKEIDQNDELYLAIMKEHVLNTGIDFAKDREDFTSFLRHIIDQPLNEARRVHINPARLKVFEENERIIMSIRLRKHNFRMFLAFLYRPFKKIQKLEEIKIALFRKMKL